MIQQDIVDEYLQITGWSDLDPKHYELVNIEPTDKQYFKEIENEIQEDEMDFYELREKEHHKLSKEELNFLIAEFEYLIESARYNKGRRSASKELKTLLAEKEKRSV